MALTKRSGIYHYEFMHLGKRHQGSTYKTDRLEAQIVLDQAKKDVGKLPRRRREDAEPGVYFLLSPSTELVKVGCSGNIGMRMREYTVANPEELYLLAKIPAIEYREAEATFHEFFKPFHVRGEWYRITTHHIEAGIGYWITGHSIFSNAHKFAKRIQDLGDKPSTETGAVSV